MRRPAALVAVARPPVRGGPAVPGQHATLAAVQRQCGNVAATQAIQRDAARRRPILDASGNVQRLDFQWLDGALLPDVIPVGYHWDLRGDQLTVTVTMHLVGRRPGRDRIQAWQDGIEQAWNRYTAVAADTGDRVRLRFEPRFVRTHRAAHEIRGGPPTGAAPLIGNVLTWPADMHPVGAAHEFGHYLGNRDEYRRSAEHRERLHNRPWPATGRTPEQLAAYVHRVCWLTRASDRPRLLVAAMAPPFVWRFHGERLKRAYQARYRDDLLDTLHQRLRYVDMGWLTSSVITTPGRRAAIATLPATRPGANLYEEADHLVATDSVMDVGTAAPGPAGGLLPGQVHPHHVREFVDIVAKVRGGQWTVEEQFQH